MFEIYCTITDELGSRSAPTGRASFLEACAHDIAADLARSYAADPSCSFHVEYVPAADAWHAA